MCYGKTLGGGLPCGVICGSARYMNRSNNDSPLQKAIVIGTFSNHPMVMSTMSQFLDWTDTNGCSAGYTRINAMTTKWVQTCNAALHVKNYPLYLISVGSVWGIRYTTPGRYHWMLQYFILNEGIKLSSIGSGRMNLRLETTPEELVTLTNKLLAACKQMADGGWWNKAATIKTTGAIYKALAKDVGTELFRRAKLQLSSVVACQTQVFFKSSGVKVE